MPTWRSAVQGPGSEPRGLWTAELQLGSILTPPTLQFVIAPTDSPANSNVSPSRWWDRLTIGLLVLLFLLPNYAWYFDTIFYANHATFGPWTARLHPHHLGYSTLIWLGGSLVPVKAVYLMLALSRVGGLGSALLLRALARDFGMDGRWANGMAVVFALAFTPWAYATNGAVYLPALVCVLAFVRVIHRWKPTQRQVLAATGWITAAVLLHQLAGLALIGALIGLGKRGRGLLLAFLPLGALYLMGSVVVLGGFVPTHFLGWVTGYGHEASHWFWNDTPQGATPLTYWLAMMRDAHARLLFATPTPDTIAYPPAMHWPLAAIVLTLGTLAAALTREWWRARPDERDTIRLLLALALPFMAFTALFEIHLAHFRLYYAWTLQFLIAIPLARGLRPSWHPLLALSGALLGALILLANLTWAWIPYADLAINPRLAHLEAVRRWPAGALALDPAFYSERNDYNYLKQLIDVRPVYRAQFLTDAQVGELIAARMLDVTSVVREGQRRLGARADRLYLDRTAIEHYLNRSTTPGRLEAHYLRLRREGEADLWLDLDTLRPIEALEAGPYGFAVFELPAQE